MSEKEKYCDGDPAVPCLYDNNDPFCEKECKNVYKDKDCKCYISDGSLATEDGKYYDTFCGFLEDGFITPCDPGCCVPKCPGQCAQTVPRKDKIEHIPTMIEVTNTRLTEITPQMSIVTFMLYIIIALAIMSTVSLWA